MVKNKIFNICSVAVLTAASFVIFSSQLTLAQSKNTKNSAWLTRCDKDEAGNTTHCEMFTRLNMQNTKQRVLEFAIGYKNNNSNAASSIMVLPLGVLTQDDVTFFIDEKAYFNTKVNYCLENGCYAHITLPDQIISKMKKGNEAALKFKAMNGKPIMVKMSLTGFTKTLQNLKKN